MPKLKLDSTESDAWRLDDLARLHDLPYTKHGNTYRFDEFNAHGLAQALGFVEGYDRAIAGIKRGKGGDA